MKTKKQILDTTMLLPLHFKGEYLIGNVPQHELEFDCVYLYTDGETVWFNISFEETGRRAQNSNITAYLNLREAEVLHFCLGKEIEKLKEKAI